MKKITLFEIPNDEETGRRRKEEWREVKKVLDVMDGYIKKRYQRVHKELYFSGEIDEDLFSFSGDEPFDFALPFFEMWYHPSTDPEQYREIFRKQTKPFALERSRDRFLFFQDYHEPTLCTSYGRLGGRESLFVDTFVLGPDYEDVITFPGIDAVYHKGMGPGRLVADCRLATKQRLEGARINPYVPGQYLWDYMGYAYEEICLNPKYAKRLEAQNKYLPNLFRILRLYEEGKGPSRDDESVVELAESVLRRFHANEFPEAFMKLWQETT